MEPFSFTIIGIACDHLTIADSIAITVQWLVSINVSVVVALYTAVRICIREPSCELLGCAFLMAPLPVGSRRIS